MNIVGKWLLNTLISLDQFGNTLAAGDPDETISSRLGKLKKKYHGRIPWYRPVARILDWGLDKIDKNHSIKSINHDEGWDALVDRLDHEGQTLPVGKPKTGLFPHVPANGPGCPCTGREKKPHRSPDSGRSSNCNGFPMKCNGIPPKEVPRAR